MSRIPELSDGELRRLLSCADKPLFVACFTPSCIPCKRILPVLHDIRKKFSNDLGIVRVDVQKYPSIAARFDVAAVPALLIVVNGAVRERIVGIVVWKDLVNKVREYIGHDVQRAGESREKVGKDDKGLRAS